jgi:LacI family transcriptional regulator
MHHQNAGRPLMDRSKVTIADVANSAAVSIGTVSNVLSGRVKVSERTLERVNRAIKEMGFIPNFHAQGLRQTSSGIIGLCLPHMVNSFMTVLSRTLEDIITGSGYSVMHIFSQQNPETELRRIKELARFRIDGLIFHPSNTPRSTLDYVRDLGMPVVLVDSANIDSRFDRVVLDNESNTRRAVEQLVELGHRRILFVCQWEHVGVTQSRLRGLKAAAEHSKHRIFTHYVSYGDNEASLGAKVGAQLGSASPPTAIIASNSAQAALLIRILREFPGFYPGKVSLLTFDDPEWSTLVSPQLSVIRQPAEDTAKMAWDLMMKRILGGVHKPRKVVLEATIQLRESVRPVTARESTRARSRK